MFGKTTRQKTGKRKATRIEPSLEGLESRVVLSTFSVNTTLDTRAVNLQTGQDATGHISLRSAIQAANALRGPDTIDLPAGVYRLTLAGPGEDAAAAGDLDITGDLTIGGRSASNTVVDGNNLDRVFEVLRGKVLDDPNSSTANGTPVIQYALHGGLNQQWGIAPFANGNYEMYNPVSGKALEDPSFSVSNGTVIVQ